MFDSERRVESSKFFIDGDLIESYLELSPTDAANLIQDFKVVSNYEIILLKFIVSYSCSLFRWMGIQLGTTVRNLVLIISISWSKN